MRTDNQQLSIERRQTGVSAKCPGRGRKTGFRIATGLRAGGIMRNTISSIPPSLRWFGA